MDNPLKKLNLMDNFTSLSTSLVSSSPKSIKNDKLQAIKERQIAKQQLIIITNRIEKLIKIKKKAEKEIHEAKSKTKQFKNKIKSKNQKAKDKASFYKEKKLFEEMQRDKFNRDNKKRDHNKKTLEQKILKEKQHLVIEKKQKSKEWERRRYSLVFDDLTEKRANKKKIYSGYVDALRLRCCSQRTHRERLKEEYNQSIETERKTANDALLKIADLEVLESELMQDLSKTLEVRDSCVENFIKIQSSYHD